MDVMQLRHRLLSAIKKQSTGDIYAGASKTSNQTLNASGDVINETGMVVTDFIKIVPETNYDISVTAGTTGSRTRRFICYDSSHNFISQLLSWAWMNSGQTSTSTITIPSNAMYLRVCNYKLDTVSVVGLIG